MDRSETKEYCTELFKCWQKLRPSSTQCGLSQTSATTTCLSEEKKQAAEAEPNRQGFHRQRQCKGTDIDGICFDKCCQRQGSARASPIQGTMHKIGHDAGSVKHGAFACDSPNLAGSSNQRAESTVLKQILKHNLNEIDSDMVRQMLQARTRKNKGETVTKAAKVVASRLKDLQAKREEEMQQEGGN